MCQPCLKDSVVAMDINITQQTPLLATLKCPNLEYLDLTNGSDISDYAASFLYNHKDSLKKLAVNMNNIPVLPKDEIGVAPQLENITIYGPRSVYVTDEKFEPFLSYAQCAKVLDFGNAGSGVPASNIHLPNLKRFHSPLRMSTSYIPFLERHSGTIETLVSGYM